MKMFKRAAGAIIPMAFLALSPMLSARCALPEPDGGPVAPSKPNVEGWLSAIGKEGLATIQTASNKRVSVRIPHDNAIYTAFGGDGVIADLKPGLHARVWYVGCKSAGPEETATSAYFEVYSFDPKDQPSR